MRMLVHEYNLCKSHSSAYRQYLVNRLKKKHQLLNYLKTINVRFSTIIRKCTKAQLSALHHC